MRKVVLFAAAFLTFTMTIWAQDCAIPDKSHVKATDPVPLCLVAAKIKLALDDYNLQAVARKDTEGKSSPTLSKAEFDFKVVRSTSIGPKISFFVFTLGTTRQVDSTDEITFSYEVPTKTHSESALAFASRENSPDFSKQLVDTLNEAARQVEQTQSVGEASFKSLTVNLAYAVKWDFTAGVTVPVQLVTIGGSFDRNKTTTQSVKLTFNQ